MSAPADIYTALAADPGLVALIGTRLYHGSLPESKANEVGARFPCVVFRAVSLAEAPESHDGLSGWERPRYQFDCWGQQDDEDSAAAVAWAVADALKAALRGSAALLGRVANALDLPEPQTRLHRVVVDAILWTEVA